MANPQDESAASPTADPGAGSEPPRPTQRSSSSVDLKTVSLVGLFTITFFFTLYSAKSLFLPIVISALLGFLLDPVVRSLQSIGLPRSSASALLLIAFLGFLGLGLQQTLEPAKKWIDNSPRSLRQIQVKVRRLMKPVEEVTQAARQVEELTKAGGSGEKPLEVRSEPTLDQSLFDGTQTLLFGLGVVMILTHFLLSSGDRLWDKMIQLLPSARDKRRANAIARQVQRDLSAHLLTITLINLALGGAVTLACYLFEMPNPFLWGAMATLLNFVPYLGAATGALILGGASFITFDSLLTAVAVPLTYLALTALEGSLITPMLLGKRLSLSPTVIFLSLFFWGWLWGIAGALLAIPILLSLKIVCDRSERLKPLGELMAR